MEHRWRITRRPRVTICRHGWVPIQGSEGGYEHDVIAVLLSDGDQTMMTMMMKKTAHIRKYSMMSRQERIDSQICTCTQLYETVSTKKKRGMITTL